MYFTIGHSNKSWEDFLSLIKLHSIDVIADVRHFPHSKTVPWFNKELMEINMKKEGFQYTHIVKLGGRRKPKKDNTNAAWQNAAFKGYADYMSTQEFKEGIDELLKLKGNIALMCAEALPWRCHRKIISDYLTAKGFEVYEIIGKTKPKLHTLPSFAKVDNGTLTYPSD